MWGFRQKVYGTTVATIKVSYEYSSCDHVIAVMQKVEVRGHDMSISQVGGWNLDIHHQYDFNQGRQT